jgi:DnaJ domain
MGVRGEFGERSHYDVLGVSAEATTAEVRVAYRRAARDHHPDAGGDGGRMSELNAAWQVLGDPVRRAAYDRALAARTAFRPHAPTRGPSSRAADMDAADGAWDAESGVFRTAEEWADLLDTRPVRPVRALDGWWAIIPPATLVAAIGLFFGAFVFTAPGLLALSGGLFVLALGLFVLAPLRAMARRE